MMVTVRQDGKCGVIGEDHCVYEASYLYDRGSNGKQDAMIKQHP